MTRSLLICEVVACLLLPVVASAQSPNWSDVIEKTSPAVVVIQTERSLGTGFVVRPNGVIVTAAHVIEGATQIAVVLASGEIYHTAFVLAEDKYRDLAILRIEGSGLAYLQLGDPDRTRIGDELLVIGTPKGLTMTVSNGILSANRITSSGTRLLQTTAPASPGSSGGPMIARDGHVVGVMSSQFADGQNLNFAVSSHYIGGMLETVERRTDSTPERILTRIAATATPRGAINERGDHSSPRGILVAAVRTERHHSYSSESVFQEIVDDMLFHLRSKKLMLANDALSHTPQYQNAISKYDLLNQAKQAGASHALLLTVDRPVSLWVKLSLECFSVDGSSLWIEQAQGGSWLSTGRSAVRAALERLKVQVNRRLVSSSLPVVETGGESVPGP